MPNDSGNEIIKPRQPDKEISLGQGNLSNVGKGSSPAFITAVAHARASIDEKLSKNKKENTGSNGQDRDNTPAEFERAKVGPEQFEDVRIEKVERLSTGDRRYKEYWEKYASIPITQGTIDNLVAFNNRAVYLYEIKGGEGEQLNHVVWIYNNPENVLPIYETVPEQEWKDLAGKPEAIERVNTILLESYTEVLDFYNWQFRPKGFVIEGSKNFGMEAGNFAGIRVSYQEIAPLIKAIESRDEEQIKRQQKHIAASIAHELTHQERDDGLMSQVQTEIASHIAQFIFNPKDNEIFNEQLEYSLDRISENRNSEEGKVQKPLHLYDKAQYIALLIVSDELIQRNGVYRDIFQSDEDPYKIGALRKLQGTINPEDEIYLKSVVLQKIIQTDSNKLVERLNEIEGQLGIQRSVTEIK